MVSCCCVSPAATADAVRQGICRRQRAKVRIQPPIIETTSSNLRRGVSSVYVEDRDRRTSTASSDNFSGTDSNGTKKRCISRLTTTVLDAVGGHGAKGTALPILKLHDPIKGAVVCKPIPEKELEPKESKSKRLREHEFYDLLQDHPLADFMPTYFGVETGELEDGEGTAEYLVLRDITDGMEMPCIVDLKMGTQTFDEEASASKREKEIAKSPHLAKMGFRVTGMKTTTANETWKPTTAWCRDLSKHTVVDAMFKFFAPDGLGPAMCRVKALLPRIQALRDCIRANPSWRFYASSLLIAYDGAADPAECNITAWMIDFAHTFPISDGGVDEGYLFGLDIVQWIFEEILSKETDA